MENIANAQGKSSVKNWFALKVVSGAEASIMHQIKLNYEAAGLSSSFEELYSPSVKVKVGKSTTKFREKQLYPGYIFIKMAMNEKTRDAVISVPKVYSFLTDGADKPKAISDSEY
jgi:transcriptional antiterminator NusG